MGERIFDDDWRACQREHLRSVVAAGERRNVDTLVEVLREIGFNEAALADEGIASEETEADSLSGAVTGEATAAPDDGPEPSVADDPGDADEPAAGEAADDGPTDDNDAPAQLSLF